MGQNLVILATFYITYFQPNKQFQPMVCLVVSKVIKCGCFGLSNEALMQIFWSFWPLFPKIGQNLNQLSGHPGSHQTFWRKH
jgi:hypothetical protein